LDTEQLGEARNSWPNMHFIYTHGYGVVAADANRLTSDTMWRSPFAATWVTSGPQVTGNSVRLQSSS